MNPITKIIAPFLPKRALARELNSQRLALLERQPLAMAGTRDTHNKGASRTAKFMRRWLPGLGSPRADLSPAERKTLVARSRDAYRNDPLARAAITRPRTHIIGSGLMLKAAVDHEALGLSVEEGEALNTSIQRAFWTWAKDPRECDLRASLNFYQQQSVALVSSFVSGDCFALTPFRKRRGTRFGLKVQLLESDRVSNPIGKVNSEKLHEGIQFDRDGAEEIYHVRTRHPGETEGVNRAKHRPIRVFGSRTGRRRAMHVFCDIDRPEQARSAPFIAPILEPLRKLEDYSEYEMSAAATTALMTVFIEHESGSELDTNDPDNIPKPWVEGDETTTDTTLAPDELKLGEAAVLDLEEGAKPHLVAPTRPNDKYEPFIHAIIKQIGAALEIPFEELLLYYSSSYSAARAAMLQAWEMYLTRRSWFVAMFCQPIYEVWFDEAVAMGIIPAIGYRDPARRAAYTKSEWIGPKRGAIDELKEARGQAQRLENGTTNLDIETMETTGRDWDGVHAGRVRTHRKLIADGLALPLEAKPTSAAPAPTDEDEEEDDNE